MVYNGIHWYFFVTMAFIACNVLQWITKGIPKITMNKAIQRITRNTKGLKNSRTQGLKDQRIPKRKKKRKGQKANQKTRKETRKPKKKRI
jgi:hypothetical protein